MRSGATRSQRRRALARAAAPVAGSTSKPELERQPHEPQRAQRVGGERRRRDHPQAPRGEVGAAAVGVDELAAGERLGHRVDGEVAGGEVGVERAALQRREVDLPGRSGPTTRQRAERVGELEGRAAGRARDRARAAGAASPVDDDVEVRRSPRPSSRSRTAPPTSQAALVGERLADGLDHAAAPRRGGTRAARGR